MGADVSVERTTPEDAPEPAGDVHVAPAGLRAVVIGVEEVPNLIDELPLIAALGARAEGTTRITGAEELRAKESDRIHAMVTNLRSLGVEVREQPDGLEVTGSDTPLRGSVRTFHDHRIAMCFGVLGALVDSDVLIDDPSVADVSFPGFADLLSRIQAVA
jgi:3-phosphoshikimate 1-carboxyvinyltransferase